MRKALIAVLAVGLVAASGIASVSPALAAQPNAREVWVCSDAGNTPQKFVIEGDKMTKVANNDFAKTLYPESGDDTFQVLRNNAYGIIAVQNEAWDIDADNKDATQHRVEVFANVVMLQRTGGETGVIHEWWAALPAHGFGVEDHVSNVSCIKA